MTNPAPLPDDIFRSTLYSIGDAVITTSADGRIMQMNSCAEGLTGWSEEQAEGQPIEQVFIVINEKTREPVENPVTRVLRSGRVAGLVNHTLLVARDGTERPIADSAAPIRNCDGNVVGVVLVFRDQTPERLEEKKLEHRLAMASAVAVLSLRLLGSSGADDDEAIHEALASVGALTDADRSYVFLLDAAGETMRNTHEVCAGGVEPQREMLQDLPCSTFPWWMKKLAARERIHVPCVADLPPEASAERDILAAQSIQSVLVVPLAWGGPLAGFVGFDAVRHARAWTDEELLALDTLANLLSLSFQRKRTVQALELERQQLAESTVRYRLITSQMAEVVLVTDDQLRVAYVSPSVRRLCGYSVTEAMEGQLEGIFVPASMVQVRASVQRQLEAISAGRRDSVPPVTLELEARRKNGPAFFVETNISLMREPIVSSVGVLLVLRDITERRALQAGLAQSDRLASMGMLAAGVAHEINNPLAYVLYNTETLVQDLPRLTAATQRCLTAVRERLSPDALGEVVGEDADLLAPAMLEDLLDRSREALDGVYRIREISRGLGTFSRVEQTDKSLVDVQHAMECALNMAFNEIKYRARVVKDYGKIPAVEATEGKLAQVFLNLLINAAHAICEGDVDGNRITVRTRFDDGTVVVQVEDTGEGIEPELLTRIFDPFFSTKGLGSGSGLGLAICKNIVEGFGGSIDVTSQRGEGSCFLVRLPVTDAKLAHPRAQRLVSSRPPVRGRILIVDDEDIVRGLLGRLLGRAHELVMAASGEDACAILEQDTEFDLILCDLMMPSMSGMDLHAWLAERDERLARQVVFVTGGAFTPRASEYLDSVENLRVDKPFDGTNLRKLVIELITAFRSRQQVDER